MTRKQRMEARLSEALAPARLEVVDESHQHSVPAGSESHFNVLIVSAAFDGCSRVERHRKVHGALSGEMKGGLHALTLTLLTPAEAEKSGEALASPACLGGAASRAGPRRPAP